MIISVSVAMDLSQYCSVKRVRPAHDSARTAHRRVLRPLLTHLAPNVPANRRALFLRASALSHELAIQLQWTK